MPKEDSNKFERRYQTEWMSGVIHEYVEILRDNALSLIEQAEEDEKKETELIVLGCLNKVRDQVESICGSYISLEKFELDEITCSDLGKIEHSALNELSDICCDIKSKIKEVFRGMTYFEEMMHFPSAINMLLESVKKMKDDVSGFNLD